MEKEKTGFTLVELLIVLVIIGILTTLILLAVGNAKNKAREASIKSSVSQMRNLAESIFNDQGASYLNWAQDPDLLADINKLRDAIDEQNRDTPGSPYTTVLAEDEVKSYCISAQLASTGSFYCVDNRGEFKITSSQCNPATTPHQCP